MSGGSFFGGRRLALGAAVLASAIPISPTANSQVVVEEPVLRVEEDWTLVLNEPDDNVHSPQFHTVMSPGGDVFGSFAQVIWNYRESPDFEAGGLQLQCYSGETLIRRRSIGHEQFSTTAETVTWTQALSTNGVQAQFEVTNGLSASWGEFGRDMMIEMDGELPFLNQYSPDVSSENACVTYGANRVDLLVLNQVRKYGAGGLLTVDATPRVIYQAGE